MRKKVILIFLCSLIAAGGLTVSASADSLKQVDRILYRYSDSGENLGKYTGFVKSDDGRRHYYKKGVLVEEKWIKTGNGKRYYADKNGTILTGKKVIGDRLYTFDDRGRWDGEEPVILDENLGISFTLKKRTNSVITAEISLDENFPLSVSYENDYRLLKRNGEEWEEMKTIREVAVLDDLPAIHPGETVKLKFYIRDSYGKLKKGEYKIAKKFDVSECNGKRTEISFMFTI